MVLEDRNRQVYKEEAQELLTELETALLELEENPEDKDLINRVFRAMHTIKGSGAMFGFDDIASFTHEVETVFDKVRNEEIKVTKELLDLTLASRDHIAAMLSASNSEAMVDQARGGELVEKLRRMAPPPLESERKEKEAQAVQASGYETNAPGQMFRVRFKPAKDLFLTGANPLALLDELAELGTSMAFAHLDGLPGLEDMDPEQCHISWDVLLTTNSSAKAIRDVFLFVEDESDIQIQLIDQDIPLGDDDTYKRLGEILLERGDISQNDLRRVLQEKKRLGDILLEQGVISKEKVEAALKEQEIVRQRRSERAASKTVDKEAASSIRVAAEKLDRLVDLVGELVIVQARISQVVNDSRDQTIKTLSEELERLSDELRDSTLSIRMLPIGTTFSKFRRLVRDLSSDLGKEIELVTHGAETELDKTVIERLNDPLVHLLRNSIDHGVETPEERKAAGKPASGNIRLAAKHSGGEVLITITDDGKGADPKAIRAKAVEKGLIPPDADLPEKECYNLLFLPGFSTAKKVTNVSGRGVGMDVVKRSIDSLRGSVVVDSELGRGTTITIKLPLTLAIIDGLQLQVGDEFFVIPLTLVEECVELLHKDRKSGSQEQRIINLRGEMVPYIRIRDWFQAPGSAPDIEQVVIVGIDGERMGIVVDNVIGEHQTVIKTLGKMYKNIKGISGATIKGDGSMALILDVQSLVEGISHKNLGR